MYVVHACMDSSLYLLATLFASHLVHFILLADPQARSRASVLALPWGLSSQHPSLLAPPLDFILAAECLYMSRVAPLLETLRSLSGPETQVLVCGIVGEGTVELFLRLVGDYFSEISVVPGVRICLDLFILHPSSPCMSFSST